MAAAVLDVRVKAAGVVLIDVAHTPAAPQEVKSLVGTCIDLRTDAKGISKKYETVVSAHCKQLFPPELYENTVCLNIHPGFNPETRGWFPQVWGILYGLKVGMTVHVIDGQLDHGAIIDRIEVPAHLWDTSESLYNRILDVEATWIGSNLIRIVNGEFSAYPMIEEGNLFKKADFSEQCKLDLHEVASFRQFYDRLRALSFKGFRNAYFVDPSSGRKVYVSLNVDPDF